VVHDLDEELLEISDDDPEVEAAIAEIATRDEELTFSERFI
jgi:hypothetical protein